MNDRGDLRWGTIPRVVDDAARRFGDAEAIADGDVRLSFILGLSLGWLGGQYVFGGLFFGFLYGAVVGIGVIAVEGKAGRKSAVPFGPFLAAGTLTWILWGSEILHWYHGLNGR